MLIWCYSKETGKELRSWYYGKTLLDHVAHNTLLTMLNTFRVLFKHVGHSNKYFIRRFKQMERLFLVVELYCNVIFLCSQSATSLLYVNDEQSFSSVYNRQWCSSMPFEPFDS